MIPEKHALDTDRGWAPVPGENHAPQLGMSTCLGEISSGDVAIQEC
jgi:hypothetical protein